MNTELKSKLLDIIISSNLSHIGIYEVVAKLPGDLKDELDTHINSMSVEERIIYCLHHEMGLLHNEVRELSLEGKKEILRFKVWLIKMASTVMLVSSIAGLSIYAYQNSDDIGDIFTIVKEAISVLIG